MGLRVQHGGKAGQADPSRFLVSTVLATGLLNRILTGLLAASALLHFYYDGFIWKVRERSCLDRRGGFSYSR